MRSVDEARAIDLLFGPPQGASGAERRDGVVAVIRSARARERLWCKDADRRRILVSGARARAVVVKLTPGAEAWS